MEDEVYEEDPLRKGLCRPAMFKGVPWPAVVLNGMVCLIAFILSSRNSGLHSGASLWHFIFYGPVPILNHFILYLICLRDPFAFSVLFTRLSKCDPQSNIGAFGCRSYEP